MTGLDDSRGCELCHDDYITFIQYNTNQGSKDICSDCHLRLCVERICKERGVPSGGYGR